MKTATYKPLYYNFCIPERVDKRDRQVATHRGSTFPNSGWGHTMTVGIYVTLTQPLTSTTSTLTMATIHPSRMNLIPQDMRSTHIERPRGRSNSPSRSRRSPSPPTRRDRSRDDRDRDRDGDRDRVGGSNGRGRRERSGSEDSLRGGHRRSQNRRSSPQYDEYRRALPPPSESSAPWRQPENMYSSKRDQPHHGRPTYGSAGADFLERYDR